MIVFELTMPHCNSWNGRWSGEGRRFLRFKDQRKVPKEYWGKSFYYNWPDGWGACVTLTQISAADYKRLERQSNGFMGYDWMIDSIIMYGDIIAPSKQRNNA